MTLGYQISITTARSALVAAKTSLQSEIAAYPTPISGFDAQFNHLLADRQKVLEALRTLDAAVFVPTPRTPTEHAGVESR